MKQELSTVIGQLSESARTIEDLQRDNERLTGELTEHK